MGLIWKLIYCSRLKSNIFSTNKVARVHTFDWKTYLCVLTCVLRFDFKIWICSQIRAYAKQRPTWTHSLRSPAPSAARENDYCSRLAFACSCGRLAMQYKRACCVYRTCHVTCKKNGIYATGTIDYDYKVLFVNCDFLCELWYSNMTVIVDILWRMKLTSILR